MARTAFVFPGQGAQYAGMGRDLYERYPEARAAFAEADEVLGFPLSRLCFEGPEERLQLTEITQPAVLAASVAALRVLEARGLRPDLVAGLSLGEYTALVAAGSLEFADALRIVHLRGRLMQEAVPPGEGAMAAVLGLDDAAVEALCREASTADQLVVPANYNCPGQVVIAGHARAVAEAARRAAEAGARRVVPLPVSAPFHTPLMRPAAERLAPVLRATPIRDAAVPVACNVDGRLRQRAEELREALILQVDHPVRWQDCVRSLLAAGATRFLEVGPGRALTGFVRRIAPGVQAEGAGDAESIESLLARAGGGR